MAWADNITREIVVKFIKKDVGLIKILFMKLA